MKIYQMDTVIIGSGAAGYNCADWLYDKGCKNIAVITEGKKVGVSRNTGSDKQTYYKLSLSGDENDSVQEMAQTLFQGGGMDGDLALVEAANSVKSFIKLANLGVDFPTNEYGEYVGYKTDHDPYGRATSVGPYTSKKMTEVLESSVEKKGICILDKCQVVKLLTKENHVVGLLALDISQKEKVEFVAVKSPHVVLATGGPAGIYYDSVYPKCHTGNSSLALEAGADFVNLSEWQFGLASVDFRWNVSGTYQQVLPRYISIDEQGVEREFLTEYYAEPLEMLKNLFLKGYEWPFDVRKIHGSSYIDLLVYIETVVKGRKVYMDFTKNPSGLEDGLDKLDEVAYTYLKNSDALLPFPIQRLQKMNPAAIQLYANHGIDITKQPLRVAVCAQHNNGGVRVDSNYQTNIKGLYCIGEAAGVFGIFRPGGTALNSTQVGGLRAARHIAYISKNSPCVDFDKIARKGVEEIERLIEKTKGETSTVFAVREKYQKQMSKSFAFLRNLSQMETGVEIARQNVKNFTKENQWNQVFDIARMLKNYDIALMCEAVAKVMYETAKRFGSRGGAYVLTGEDVLARNPKIENEEGRKKVLVAYKKDGEIVVYEQDVKPIPTRNLWFEKVWNEYKQIKGSEAQ